MATEIITGSRNVVMAPEPGLLWTPGYWVFRKAFTFFSRLWGPHVGFYGGVNYGYGYTGVGFWAVNGAAGNLSTIAL